MAGLVYVLWLKKEGNFEEIFLKKIHLFYLILQLRERDFSLFSVLRFLFDSPVPVFCYYNSFQKIVHTMYLAIVPKSEKLQKINI